MVAHLYLLINIFTNNIQETTNWTKLPDGTTVAEEDVKQGKIVVRTVKEKKIYYMNIRDALEKLHMPQLLQYNVGICTASTRTSKQR